MEGFWMMAPEDVTEERDDPTDIKVSASAAFAFVLHLMAEIESELPVEEGNDELGS